MALEYINDNYSRGIGVTEIADHVGITRSHLNHLFQQELNISIQNYLMDFRMYKAANLLVSSSMPVKEVSVSVGYRDQLVFSKAFKKKFGMSPTSYRTYSDELETRGG